MITDHLIYDLNTPAPFREGFYLLMPCKPSWARWYRIRHGFLFFDPGLLGFDTGRLGCRACSGGGVAAGASSDELRCLPAGSAAEARHVTTCDLRGGNRSDTAEHEAAIGCGVEPCLLARGHRAVAGPSEDHTIRAHHPSERHRAVDVGLRRRIRANHDRHITSAVRLGPRLGAAEKCTPALGACRGGQHQGGRKHHRQQHRNPTPASNTYRQTPCWTARQRYAADRRGRSWAQRGDTRGHDTWHGRLAAGGQH